MSDPIIQFDHFSFQYHAQAEPTLHDITLSIRKGEKVLICGPSGCGKSTLAHSAMIAVAGLALCLPTRASTFTVGGSGNTFTVSAFPGQHYTEKSGTLVFAPGQPSTNITVSAATLSDGAYMYPLGQVIFRFRSPRWIPEF